MSRRWLQEEDDDDPVLSLVNLIDIFLVLVAALLLVLGRMPFIPGASESLTIIRNEGQPNMEIIMKKGARLEHFQTTGSSGQGQGVKAGVAYRLKDGTLIYVPE